MKFAKDYQIRHCHTRVLVGKVKMPPKAKITRKLKSHVCMKYVNYNHFSNRTYKNNQTNRKTNQK